MDFQDQQKELSAALSEALTCKTCNITISKKTFAKDIDSGAYNPLSDPPFILPDNGLFGNYPVYEYVSPSTVTSPLTSSGQSDLYILDSDGKRTTQRQQGKGYQPRSKARTTETTTTPRPGYKDLITPAQTQEYQSQTTKYLIEDPDVDVLFAQYKTDYHVHLHWLSRRGPLTLCRDVNEVQEMQKWMWKVGVGVAVEGWGYYSDEGRVLRSGSRARTGFVARRKGRGAGWPGDSRLFMVHQMAVWSRSWMRRRKGVDGVRERWAGIVARRRRRRRWQRGRQRGSRGSDSGTESD